MSDQMEHGKRWKRKGEEGMSEPLRTEYCEVYLPSRWGMFRKMNWLMRRGKLQRDIVAYEGSFTLQAIILSISHS